MHDYDHEYEYEDEDEYEYEDEDVLSRTGAGWCRGGVLMLAEGLMRRRVSSMSMGMRLLILALVFSAGCQTGPAEEACRVVVSRCGVEAPDLGFVGDAQSFNAFSSIPLAGEPGCDGLDETFCGRALGDLFECLERHGVCGPGVSCVSSSYDPDVEPSDVCCIEVKRLQAFCSPDPEP